MIQQCALISLVLVGAVVTYPYLFETTKFRVGIEYDHSLPMSGGSDRYRHRNNYDPFFVTITATAKTGFVISYIDVSATVASSGEVDFHLVRGATGQRTMTFQLVSNHSDFLAYSYLAHGIRAEEYKKISNIITLPVGSDGLRHQSNEILISAFILTYLIFYFIYS